MTTKLSRRELLKKTTVTLLGGSFLLAGAEERALAEALQEGVPAAEDPAGKRTALPCGKIGDLSISRMILGGNLIGGWAHARDLLYVSRLFKAYNTPERIMKTLRLAENNGINTVLITPKEMHFVKDYNTRYDGHMQTMCQIRSVSSNPHEEVDEAFEYGADTMYVQGSFADNLVKNGQMDLLRDVLERIKLTGCPGGVGAHALTVIEECERRGVEADYYVKTLHPDQYWSAHPRGNRHEFEVDMERFPEHDKFHDNIFDLYPEKTIGFMKKVNKPWVAFKTLAAGAVDPRTGFHFAFQNGADFIAAGMFDFQVEEDVRIASDACSASQVRERSWYA